MTRRLSTCAACLGLVLGAALMITTTSDASAQDARRRGADFELLCLDSLDVNPVLPIAQDVLGRSARVHAQTETNCLVVDAPEPRLDRLRQLLSRLDERARRRRAARGRRSD